MTIFCYNQAYAASGWTSFGKVNAVQADSNGITVYTDISTNPSSCSNKKTLYYPYSAGTNRGNRLYATILSAQARGVTIRLYVDDTCNSFGQTRFTAVNSK
jgi:hypothetical protein